MSTIFPQYPLGFTQIYLDLFAADKGLVGIASYLCFESKTSNRSLRRANMLAAMGTFVSRSASSSHVTACLNRAIFSIVKKDRFLVANLHL
jgi:hypothetical protein